MADDRMKQDEIVSGYADGTVIGRDGTVLDFAKAQKIDTAGTVCDAYRIRQANTLFFVKKLKDVHRGNPVYRDALAKEYEIGSSLEHPSLPVYRFAVDDYIVMNYIDGETLQSLIEKDDALLHSEKNVIRLLNEVLDVIAYLHRRDIVHCDIKPDNLIITHNNHHVKLLDLDKCYADSRIYSSGAPGLYGVDRSRIGARQIDFNGLGLIARRLSSGIASSGGRRRIGRFAAACLKDDVSIDTLRKLLERKPTDKRWWYAGAAVAMSAVAILTANLAERQEYVEDIATESLPVEAEQPVVQPDATVGESLDPVVIGDKALAFESYDVNNKLEQTFRPLYETMERIETVGLDSLSEPELAREVADLAKRQLDVIDRGFDVYREFYPNSDYTTAYQEYINTTAFKRMQNRMIQLNQKIGRRFEDRNAESLTGS